MGKKRKPRGQEGSAIYKVMNIQLFVDVLPGDKLCPAGKLPPD